MSPLEQARAIYEADGLDFGRAVEAYLREGCVYCTPTAFVMAVAGVRFGTQPDCWFVAVRTGDIAECWRFEPFPLPWYCFTKKGSRLHYWPRDRIRALTSRHLASTTS